MLISFYTDILGKEELYFSSFSDSTEEPVANDMPKIHVVTPRKCGGEKIPLFHVGITKTQNFSLNHLVAVSYP